MTTALTTPTRDRATGAAGIVAALAAGGSGAVLAQGEGTFADQRIKSSAELVEAMNPELMIRIGGGLGLVAVIATTAFTLGLVRRAGERGGWAEALRWSSIALLATTSIGVLMRYVAAGGAPGAMDQSLYSTEASATAAVLADQMSTGAYLPALGVMSCAGMLALRGSLLPAPVGIVALVLGTLSLAATLGLGLPYSSSLVFPVFALVAGITLLVRPTGRRPSATGR
ncbi:hypothetical protein [Pseudonocardia oroxyli]|uniref:DUF4386 domain-containing protein n=1 Tax=Pseudonocardia oroxyli TaxID=366584 RepID=A0A1G7FKR2_PSEOR|nr:hypothetical protein [Pseudonocardia oroxyli]SDE76440.1 hypothetical protein SAMN05216377_10218 [Pseudonocardia oroxyli]